MKLFKKKKVNNEVIKIESPIRKIERTKIDNLPDRVPTAYLLEGRRTFAKDGITYKTIEVFLYRPKVDEDGQLKYDFLLLTGEKCGRLYKNVSFERDFSPVVDTIRSGIKLDEEFAINDVFVQSDNFICNQGEIFFKTLKDTSKIDRFQLINEYQRINNTVFTNIQQRFETNNLIAKVWEDIDKQK